MTSSTPIPDAPMHLGPLARQRWAELHSIKPFALAKHTTLAAYCAAWAKWVEAEQWIYADPENPRTIITITDDKGNVKSHGPAPQVKIAEASAREAVRLGRILGI